jgi:hypothetical protein
MRLDLPKYDFKVWLSGPCLGSKSCCWNVSASPRFGNIILGTPEIAFKGKRHSNGASFLLLLDEVKLAISDPENWVAPELSEHLLRQDEEEWAKEQNALGRGVQSHPVCPRCDRDLAMRDMNLTGEGIATCLICVEHCDYVPTVYSSPYKKKNK